MHNRAIPPSCKATKGAQRMLDGSLATKIPEFTKSGLMDYIVELIVSEDEAFQLINKGPFRRLLQYLQPSLSDRDIPHRTKTHNKILEWAKVSTVCCTEHALHLAAKHFVEEVAPTPASVLLKNTTTANDDDDDKDKETDFDVADTVGKALALVTQCCAEVNEPNLELLKWIRTQWASLFGMLEHTLKLHKLVDDSNEVPNLQGKLYGTFKLSAKEWKKLELMHDVLQEPANAQQSFSATRKPTVWHAILVLEFLQQTWQNMAGSSKFANFSTTIDSGIDNLHKWYHKINETDVYFICLALDPNYKIAYAKSKWEPCDFNKGMRCLQIVFNKYYHHNSLLDAEPAVVAPSSLSRSLDYMWAWVCILLLRVYSDPILGHRFHG
ncbi:uncharacterized protein BJ212DRAFT_1295664 [Suillus subaureus]|uniref:hAT-like transposase RNase-H fold domain-containing protein n=1 Tax=Suillus subaureus TaxID=48587 RepID=A0A9P7ELK8_9AGAM|nr:uncharacterized protein BJ212DRAFT_1295664 [Suillus subaureus]KAG1824515.1 hypothetical protein BJ212DRAFT_1295664 [Suillus subaureus]